MIQGVGIVEEWLIEREAKGVRETLLAIGRKRFGEPSEDVLQVLTAISSVETLQQLAERLLDVESWEDLLHPA